MVLLPSFTAGLVLLHEAGLYFHLLQSSLNAVRNEIEYPISFQAAAPRLAVGPVSFTTR